jgi:hypothetical protein
LAWVVHVGLPDRQHHVGDDRAAAAGQGQDRGPPGLLVAGDLVVGLQIRVDHVDEAAVLVLLEAVERRLLERLVGEVVEPVAA